MTRLAIIDEPRLLYNFDFNRCSPDLWYVCVSVYVCISVCVYVHANGVEDACMLGSGGVSVAGPSHWSTTLPGSRKGTHVIWPRTQLYRSCLKVWRLSLSYWID